jgi:membrane protein YqaA with SNARE-associated domain
VAGIVRDDEQVEPVATPPVRERPGRLRRFYDWVLREAHTVEGGVGLVVLSFTGSAIIPLLLEPPLVVLTSGIPRLWRRFALLFALGSIIGGVFTYVIGYAFIETIGQVVIRAWAAEGMWQHFLDIARSKWGFAMVAAISLGPGPYKIITMAAGAAAMPFPAFLGILVVGRCARFLAVGWLTRVFGPRVSRYIGTRTDTAHYVAFVALGVAAILVYLAFWWVWR